MRENVCRPFSLQLAVLGFTLNHKDDFSIYVYKKLPEEMLICQINKMITVLQQYQQVVTGYFDLKFVLSLFFKQIKNL